ncbi:MAG: hypothetical protein EOP48_12825 [Sphingobacteriales bacterium]|nr:MAG: hypothetical protein EOP48_12825 [Sphingobacteriales bacterium]
MKSPYNTTFSDAILTSVFVGMLTTLACMAYYLGYKEVTGFPLSSLINVSSLIFLINVLFLVIGFIYYALLKASTKGEMFYIIGFVLLTIYSVWLAYHIHRSADPIVNLEFHQLLTGIFVIIGISAFTGIPVLYHNKKFHDEVL